LINDVYALITEKLDISRKIFFGISSYGVDVPAQKIALAVKKALKMDNISCRWVQSKEKALSSVAVKTNKLLSKRGAEIVFLSYLSYLSNLSNLSNLGITKTVQPFSEFSQRDYGRPCRDARSGMLPPKLAKIMINLAGVDASAVILDPFCGSGTILQEALLMGYKNIIGSDISSKAIADTQKNLDWLGSKARLRAEVGLCKLIQSDVRTLAKHIKPNTIDAIITEPYLGPPIKGNESKEKADKIVAELRQLYQDSFDVFTKLIKPKGTVIFICPIIKGVKVEFDAGKFKKEKSFTYSREGQRVKRKILIFKF